MPFSYAPDCALLLRRHGYTATIVEKYSTRRQRSEDFLGFGDVLAYRPHFFSEGLANLSIHGSLVVQACTSSALAAHFHKVMTPPISDRLRDWLLCGNRFELWSYPSSCRTRRYIHVPHPTKPNRILRQLAIRFIQVTHDGSLFFTEETTELSHYGYTLATHRTPLNLQP